MLNSHRLDKILLRIPRDLLRWLAAASVIVGWGVSASSFTVAAGGLNRGTASIMLLAPGASLGSTVSVQYQDGLGQWHPVKGWSGSQLQLTDKAGAPYIHYAVVPANFRQGPFRWVVYNPDQTVWGISENFNLPPGAGILLQETIMPPARPPALTPGPTDPPPAMPTIDPRLQLHDAGQSYMGLGGRTSNHTSAITGYFLGVPADAWITVQWGDGLGNYQTVTGWQGNADQTSATGQLIKQFMVDKANFGQGPFRWAIYEQQDGTLLALSADFTLPAKSGVNYFMAYKK